MSPRLNIRSADLPDRSVARIVAQLTSVCDKLGFEFFVIGAAARDLILVLLGASPAVRITKDVDVAIAIDRWQDFDNLAAALEAEFGYTRSKKIAQRLQGDDGALLDVVPFGGVESPPGEVHFPTDADLVLSTIGFREVFRGCVRMRIDNFEVRVASMPGIVTLKIVAWSDRPNRAKDAEDICFILRNYGPILNMEMYEKHVDVLEKEEWDLEFAGARLLGRETAQLLYESAAVHTIGEILIAQLQAEYDGALLRSMGIDCAPIERRLGLLAALARGFKDDVPPSLMATTP